MNSKRQAALISLSDKIQTRKDKAFDKAFEKARRLSTERSFRLKGNQFTLWTKCALGENSFTQNNGILSICFPDKETELYFPG